MTRILSLRRRILVPAAFESIGDKYRSTGGTPLCFVHHHDSSHSAESAADAATPYPAPPDFPLFRGQNIPLYVQRLSS